MTMNELRKDSWYRRQPEEKRAVIREKSRLRYHDQDHKGRNVYLRALNCMLKNPNQLTLDKHEIYKDTDGIYKVK